MCTCCAGSLLFWFCRKSTYGCRAAFRCCSLHFCHSKRPAPSDDSQSDVEEGDQCQAESIAVKFPSLTQSLVCTPCHAPSVGEPQSLLDIDEQVSNLSDLAREGGSFVFRCCAVHRNEYLLSRSKRACAIQDCNRAGTLTPLGIRVCPTHASEALIMRHDTDKQESQDKSSKTTGFNSRLIDMLEKIDKTSSGDPPLKIL